VIDAVIGVGVRVGVGGSGVLVGVVVGRPVGDGGIDGCGVVVGEAAVVGVLVGESTGAVPV
jgi:hypothetical protein